MLLPDQLSELRAMLEAELQRLKRSMELSGEAARPVELDQTAVGRLSRMDSLQNQSMTRSLHEREEARFAELQGALARMDEGTYGACTECGSAISVGRLMIFPEAATCSACSSV